MSDDCTRLLRLLARQSGCDADFERGRGLPALIARTGAQAQRESFEASDEDAIGEALFWGARRTTWLVYVICIVSSSGGGIGREVEGKGGDKAKTESFPTYLINDILENLVLILRVEIL